MQLSLKETLTQLEKSQKPFIELFKIDTVSVELYKPTGKDYQQPHDRDEIYVITSGHGNFFHNEIKYEFNPGDLFFVPAFEPHRFEDFSSDFVTWVIFCSEIKGKK